MPDAAQVAAYLVAFVLAITVHEFSHAATAYALGDHTAKREGRLTLNPLRHLDPMGSLLLAIVIFTGAPGIGWGKPVPVDPWALRGGRRGMAIVSAAGPASNVILAVMTRSLLIVVLEAGYDVPSWATTTALAVIGMNIGLAAFNILPLPPLDGFGLVIGILPRRAAEALAGLERHGMGILLLLVFAPSILRVDLLGIVLDPLISLVAAFVRIGAATVSLALGM